MRYFSLLDFQHLVLAFFLGALALVFAVAAWGASPRREGDVPPPAAAETPTAEQNPMAPFLVLVYVGAGASALGYAVVVGLLGGPVGY